MGYYTNVEIEIIPVKSGADIEPASNALSKLFLEERFVGSMAESGIGEFFLEDARWEPDDVDKVAKISKDYPDVVFQIWGDGEGSEDIWQFYCYRGHIQCGLELVYIPFNSDYCEKEVRQGLLLALSALRNNGYKNDDPIIMELERRCEEGNLSVYDGT